MEYQKLSRMASTKSRHLEQEIRPKEDTIKNCATYVEHNYGNSGLGKDDAGGLETQKIRQLEEENKQMKEALAQLSIQLKPTSKAVKTRDKAEEETIEEIIPVDHQRGLIPEADRWKLQRHTHYLVNELDAIELINILYSQFVYDIDDYELLLNILERAGRYKCVMNMLMILSRKGPNAYIQFLVALERCNYTWVIKKLEPDCVIYKGKIKYSGQKFYELVDNTSPKYKEFVKRCENNIEQVYQDKPGQQFVVVKKLEKGCVEVTFHLISLGATDDDGLHRCLNDVIGSGFIGTDSVKPDAFSFHRITDEQIAQERELRTSKRINDLENEIHTLKSKVNDLEVENAALKSASLHASEIEKYKEHESKKYADRIQELESKQELVIWCLQKELDQMKIDYDKLQSDYGQLRHDNEKIAHASVTLQTNKKKFQQELDILLSDHKKHHQDESDLAPFHQDVTYIEYSYATFKKEVDKWRSGPISDIPCSGHATFQADTSVVGSVAGGPHISLQQERTNIRPDHSPLEQQLNKLQSLHTTILQTLTKLQSESDYYDYGSVLCDYLMMLCDRRKIIRNKKFLLSKLQDKIQSLVELLSDRNVLHNFQRKTLISHIKRGDTMKATSDLLNMVTDDPDPSLYNQFIQSLHELRLSHVLLILNQKY